MQKIARKIEQCHVSLSERAEQKHRTYIIGIFTLKVARVQRSRKTEQRQLHRINSREFLRQPSWNSEWCQARSATSIVHERVKYTHASRYKISTRISHAWEIRSPRWRENSRGKELLSRRHDTKKTIEDGRDTERCSNCGKDLPRLHPTFFQFASFSTLEIKRILTWKISLNFFDVSNAKGCLAWTITFSTNKHVAPIKIIIPV